MNIHFVTGLHRAGTHSFAEHIAKENNCKYIEESVIKWDSYEAVELIVNHKLPIWKGSELLGFDLNSDWNLKPLVLNQQRWRYKQLFGKNGIVIHCPGLAHRTLDLAEHGKVYWVTRNKLDVVTSMRNAGMNQMAWHIMKGFREQFPNDEIWPTLKYNGSKDVYFNFVGYYDILVDVKEYFYKKYFKEVAELIQTEKQSYYDFSETLTARKPLKKEAIESIRLCKA